MRNPPFARSAQDELLSSRSDLMTVYREVSTADDRLFPLRYARSTPRRSPEQLRRVAADAGTIPPQVPLLLIPDGPGIASVLQYDALRGALSRRGVDVLMMEHRGVGLSRLDSAGRDLPQDAMRLREVLADLVAVLDHARADQVAVYGCGYGAYLAQALAIEQPSRVHSLVLDSPWISADDDRCAQRTLRAMYWNGEVPSTASTAAALRHLAEQGVIDARHAGPVVLAVHEHSGPEAVRDLVDQLVQGRGTVAWNAVRQVLVQDILQSTPYVAERDLTSYIAHTELGRGIGADGGPLDPLVLAGAQMRALPPFESEPFDLRSQAARITAPTLVMTGGRDLVTPSALAVEQAGRIPGAGLLRLPEAGHALLDVRSPVAMIASRWAVSGMAVELEQLAGELSAIPPALTDRAVSGALRLALTAESRSPIQPVRRRIETARTRRAQMQRDPTARRSRTPRR